MDLRRNDLEGARLSLKNAPHLRQSCRGKLRVHSTRWRGLSENSLKSSIEVLDLSGNALTTVEACGNQPKHDQTLSQGRSMAKI